jgi:ribosomal protein S7
LNKNKWKNSKNIAVKAFPFLLNTTSQYKKSILWLIQSIKLRSEHNLSLKIYYEFYDILFNFGGNTLKKKKDYYKHIILFKTVKKFKW